MCAANSLFAAMTLLARLASRSATWATIGASRAFMGIAVALLFAWGSGSSLKTKNPRLTWARSILGTISTMATFYALSQPELSVGDAVTLLSTAPLFIAAFSPRVLGETPGKSLWLLLLVAFAGVSLIAGAHLHLRAWPALAALLAAFTSASAMMFLRMMRSGASGEAPESTAAIALHFAVVAFVVLAIANLFSFQRPTGQDTFYLLLAGACGGLAQLLMTRAYALTQAARLGGVSYLGTVLAFVGGIVLLGEEPVLSQLLGAVLVVGSGVLLAIAPRNPSDSAKGLVQRRP